MGISPSFTIQMIQMGMVKPASFGSYLGHWVWGRKYLTLKMAWFNDGSMMNMLKMACEFQRFMGTPSSIHHPIWVFLGKVLLRSIVCTCLYQYANKTLIKFIKGLYMCSNLVIPRWLNLSAQITASARPQMSGAAPKSQMSVSFVRIWINLHLPLSCRLLLLYANLQGIYF